MHGIRPWTALDGRSLALDARSGPLLWTALDGPRRAGFGPVWPRASDGPGHGLGPALDAGQRRPGPVWDNPLSNQAHCRYAADMSQPITVAALYVAPDGIYHGLDGVELWDEVRDARLYPGPHPVVAHPPCQRWGRFWHGSTRKPHQYKLGDDQGCFASAIAAVRKWGGVLEHPEASHAWRIFGLTAPPRSGGWVKADGVGWTCCVEQGHYGHLARKATWLYVVNRSPVRPPRLTWGECRQRLHPVALERYGYLRARRIGMMAMVGGKRKTEIRNATPVAFRDLLISIARSVAVAGR